MTNSRDTYFNRYCASQETVKATCFVFLFLILFLRTETIYAQTDSAANNAQQTAISTQQEENLNVFQQWIKWSSPGSMVMNHLTKQALDLYKKRENQIALLKTKNDWINRQQFVKNKLKELTGTFPEKGPLNPEITGIVQKDGYRIEKIIFQPTPGYYEIGCLFIPDKITGRAPAILNVIGHDQASFKEEYYQVIITNLVKKGMIVFVIDPLGQGEHIQYYDPEVKFSAIGYSVIEHCYFGNLCFLTGASSAKYFIWDGIRAIDYLLTRKEVDPERIGVTGFSGGGTVSAYLGAFDDRIKVSVPCSWSIANRGLIETKGIQDNESIFVHSLAKGISFEDILEVRTPKPTLLAFTSRDEYLSLQGARDAYLEAKNAYWIFGREANLDMVEDDYRHWMTPKIRLAIYAFFMKHFNLSGNPAEEKTDMPSVSELTVTPTGQIASYKGGLMIFDLNKKEADKHIAKLEESRKTILPHLDKVKLNAKKISGYVPPGVKSGKPFTNGRYQREGYTVEKLAIVGEQNNYAIPILLFKPDDNLKKHKAVIYLDSRGKINEAKPGGEIEQLVKKGYIVAAADVLGVGETVNAFRDKEGKADAGTMAVLIGRSLVGIQAGDIVRVVNYVKSRTDTDPLNVGAIATDEICIPLIHAAAFDRSIKSITLIGSPISYRSIITNRIYKIGLTPTGFNSVNLPYFLDFSWTIAGVITGYDLPDLIGCIAPRKVVLAELKNHVMDAASEELVQQELAFPRSVYSSKQISGNIRVLDKRESLVSIVNWGFE